MKEYYQRELANLRNLGKEFSHKHPSAAPLLSAETADPDVERLLEGVAFLTALLRKKLDDDLPEIIHNLAEIIFPHFLRPIPSASIVSFSPKPALQEKVIIKKGISIASNPIDDVSCIFRTCFDIEAHPVKVEAVDTVKEPGKPQRIIVRLKSKTPLSQFNPELLYFYLGGSFVSASELFMFLNRYLDRIIINPLSGGEPCILSSGHLLNIGFNTENELIPFPEHVFSGFRLLQEYFILPQKFLFIGISGWDKWTNRGDGTDFEIIFEFKQIPSPLPAVGLENFVLFATPVINIFPMDAEPVTLDHTKDKIRITPSSEHPEHIQVYEVSEIRGFTEGTVEKIKYTPFNVFSLADENQLTYQIIHRLSPITEKPETYVRFLYTSAHQVFKNQTLTIKTLCTNGDQAEKVRLGDICMGTATSPELFTFQNIIPVTSAIEPLLKKDKLWNFLSHLSLNLLSIANLNGLKKLLRFYTFPDSRDRIKVSANLKRIDGIESIDVRPSNRLIEGLMLLGQEIELTIRKDNFASMGDLYLFGSVLNEFFSQYTHINSFTHLKVKDSITGDTFEWKERIGKRHLL